MTHRSPTLTSGSAGATPADSRAPSRPIPAAQLRLVLLALAVGAFAIGTTEFASMGLLPQIAEAVHVSIPQAGMLISLYALGVVIGAPLVTIAAARMHRTHLLVLLISMIGVGNLLSALAPNFTTLAIARFIAGFPHGAFFGIAALVASRLSPTGHRARSVSLVMLGLTVATMVGVPMSTAFGQILGWRLAYAGVVLIAATSALAIWRVVPEPPGPSAGSAVGELRAFRRPQVWFGLGIGSIGFGGMFAVYSYVGELVPSVMGLSPRAVPIALLVFGFGMTVGNLLAGRLTDISVYGTIFTGLASMAATLVVFALVAPTWWAGMAVLFLIAVASQLLGPSLQVFLLDASPDAPSLAGALHHSALNVGNSLGAALGAAVLAAGWGLLAPTWTGVLLALVGLLIAAWSLLVHRRSLARAAAADGADGVDGTSTAVGEDTAGAAEGTSSTVGEGEADAGDPCAPGEDPARFPVGV